MIAHVLLALALQVAVGHAPLPRVTRLAGHWEGAFSRMGAVQLASVDLRVEGDSLAGTFAIGDLGLAGEPLKHLVVSDSTIAFDLLYGHFEMHVDSAATELTGSNPRWNPVVDLHLKRVAPTPSYTTETVRIPVHGATIEGTLYRPMRRDPAPLVVVAGGSQQTTRTQWEYRSWGDVLARHGIAAFVYDRRGSGASTGDSSRVDLRTESGDVVGMVHALARRSDIDPARVGVLGASRGGWVATLAATRSPEVRMLIFECAPAVGVVEQELQRVSHVEATDSIRPADVAAATAFERAWLGAALRGAPWSVIDSMSRAARTATWRSIAVIPESEADAAWWRRNEIDEAALLRHVHVPVLAFFGANDRTVPVDGNLDRMRTALAAGGDIGVTVRVIPEADHGLWLFGRLLTGDWKWPTGYWRWARKAPGVFDSVVEWIGNDRARM